MRSPKREIIRTISVGGQAGAQTLDELLDVEVPNSQQGDVLIYDEATGKYKPGTIAIINGGTF